MELDSVRALTFDVFGTVVDWRGGVAREARAIAERHGIEADWGAFADAWRCLYGPSMVEVREGRRPWAKLDDLHREGLEKIKDDYGLGGLSEVELTDLTLAWHRLDPWPDSVPGLTLLKQRFILGTLSNGNVALMVNMAKRGGLPWDVILGGEVVRRYKPDPHAYLDSAALLGLEPQECMMVAAHQYDLDAAARCGFRTAYVHRPHEFPNSKPAENAARFDVVASDFEDLATRLDC